MQFRHNHTCLKLFRFVQFVLLLMALAPGVLLAQQSTFSSAEMASEKLYTAILNKDKDSVKSLLGTDKLSLLPLDSIDEQDRSLFIKAWKKSHKLIAGTKGEMFIEVGTLGWTFPIPIKKSDNGWFFDTATGVDIVTTRRIGRNELSAMQAVLAYYDAQNEYAEQDRNGDGSLEYAQRFISTEGQKDGLYWEAKENEPLSPLGTLFSAKTPEGAYHGYYYKILKAQGEHARGGSHSYMAGNRMKSGFALVAWPAEYDDSGVISFIINYDGILYEKNLGPDTAQIVARMDSFNPDETWVHFEENSKK
ncbi:MAG: DUF2950 domain-containing protein [Gammaproteobacteria bacterium]|nr:DUF2950 domain-containing protein [Gammaproteobacteria bacterium]